MISEIKISKMNCAGDWENGLENKYIFFNDFVILSHTHTYIYKSSNFTTREKTNVVKINMLGVFH